MQDKRIAKRYAEALFETAKQASVLESVHDDLLAIVASLNTGGAFHVFLSDPNLSREEKTKVMVKVFSDRVTALTMYLVRLLLNKGRETELPLIQACFEDLYQDYKETVQATIVSARPLSDELKDKLISKLKAQCGKSVKATFEIDSTLIGGVKVDLGAVSIDGSVKGSLQRLRDRLLTDLTSSSSVN